MNHTYVHPDTLKKAKNLLGRDIPKPDTPEWDDLLDELAASDDEAFRAVGDELNQNVIFSGVGDPKEKQVKAARRNEVKQSMLHAFFYRRGQDGKQQVLNKLKIAGLISVSALTLFTIGFFANRFGLLPRTVATPVTAQTTPEVTPVPVDVAEEASPFSVSVPPFERVTPSEAPATTVQDEPTPVPAPAAPSPAPSPAPSSASAGEETVIAVTRSEKVPGGVILRSPPNDANVNLVRSGPNEGGLILRSSNKTSGTITSSHDETGSSIASSNNSGSVAGGSSPTVGTSASKGNAEAASGEPQRETTPATNANETQQTLPGSEHEATEAASVNEVAETPTPASTPGEGGEAELQGFEAALQRAREELKDREPPSESVTYSVGDMLGGSLVFGVLTTGEDELPVLVMDENNVMWRGTAKLNALSRVEVNLTHYIQNGTETQVSATVLDVDSYPGIKATMREAAPTLAADMIQASLKGVTDYVRDLSANRTTTFLQDQVVVQDTVVPLEWAIAGSLTDLFTPKQPAQALVRVGEVPVGTQVKIMILQ